MTIKRKLFRFGAILAALAIAFGLPLAFAASTTSSVQTRSSVSVAATGTPASGLLVWNVGTAGVSTLDFTNGSGNLAINKVYVAAAAVNTTVDLDSSLTDPAGGTVTFSRIAYVRVIAGSANAANISVKGDFILTKYLVPAGDTLTNMSIPVHPNGRFEFAAPNATGVAITAATGDELTITVTGSDSFTLMILGS